MRRLKRNMISVLAAVLLVSTMAMASSVMYDFYLYVDNSGIVCKSAALMKERYSSSANVYIQGNSSPYGNGSTLYCVYASNGAMATQQTRVYNNNMPNGTSPSYTSFYKDRYENMQLGVTTDVNGSWQVWGRWAPEM